MTTILQIIKADRNLSLFSRGLVTAELETKLSETGPFTILGPVNLAFNRLTSLTFEKMLEPSNRSNLLDLLSGYIIAGKKMFYDFRHDQKLQTLNGKNITVTVTNGDTMINGARILAHNRQGSNGVVHLLDKTYAVAKVE